jgi:hypothetical protein
LVIVGRERKGRKKGRAGDREWRRVKKKTNKE